jgi:hypothetical protein
MKLSVNRKVVSGGRTHVLGKAALVGRFSVPAPEVPAAPPVADPPVVSVEDKTFTQAQLNAISAREKAQGKAAGKAEAEQALADMLGVPLEEAKTIIAERKTAEDAKKSDADKDREKAAKELADAEKAKADAALETHAARVERALAREGFVTDDTDEGKKKLDRVQRLVTVAVGASLEDVLADVQSVKADFPELFGGAKAVEGDGRKPKGKLPNSDPAGKPKAPNGGEDKFAAGQKRFEEEQTKHRGYNPLEKTGT